MLGKMKKTNIAGLIVVSALGNKPNIIKDLAKFR